MSRRALVTGGGIEAIQTALDLADWGAEVTLVEESSSLHADSLGESQSDKSAEALLLMPKLLRAANHRNIRIITNSSVTQVKGEKGDFRVTIIKHPRYVDVAACASCGRCEAECPVDIIPCSAEAGNGHKAIHRPGFGIKSVPSAYAVEKKGIPPCTAACPAGVNAHGYVALVSKGKFSEALDLITEAVPFPRVLGRVCSHPCESKCTRGKIDQAVSICALKRFVADSSSTESSLKRAQASNNGMKVTDPPRVAIIGAGPAGLTAARDLARLGHRATVFEALPVPGGMITVGMPRFRLPREVRQADIDDIVRLGIEIRTSTQIGRDLTLQDLKRQGYEAILIATGAHRNQRLSIPGENLSGVIDSIALLQALNLKQPITVGKKVVVVGGGYTAIDSARTAVRLHCERVLILYRRSLEEMPANAEEVAEAQEEGVEIEFLVAPIRIIGQEGRVAGVECIRMRLGESDSSGRRRPLTIGGSEFVVEADTVIVAVGQRPDLSFLGGDAALTDGRKHIVIDHLTMATKIPGIFAAGDVAGEPGTMIDAITSGRRAAVSIDRFLRGEQLKEKRSTEKVAPVEVKTDEIFIPPVERQQMPRLRHEERLGNFEEVDLGFTARMAVSEARRCLNCGGCSECLECERACELNAIDHNLATEPVELRVNAIISIGNPALNQADAHAIIPHSGIYFMAPSSQNGDLSQASAVAARVMVDLMKSGRPGQDGHKAKLEASRTDIAEPIYSRRRQPSSNLEPRVGIFVCGCGGNVSGVVDVPGVVEYCQGLHNVAYSGEISYACTDQAAAEIKSVMSQQNLTHVVLAACSCCSLDQICFSCSDRRLRCKSNLLDGSQPDVGYEFVNIREHCAWVHHSQPRAATAKAKGLIRAGLARVRESQFPTRRIINVNRSALVLGSSLSGMQAAADLAAQGFQTILVSRNGQSERDALPHDSTSKPSRSLEQRLESELAKSGAIILRGARLTDVEGTAGNYQATVVQNGKPRTFTVGAIIFDLTTGTNGDKSKESSSYHGVKEIEFPPHLLKAFRNSNGRQMFKRTVSEPVLSQLPGLFLCGTGRAADAAEALIQGSAAAGKASILLNKGILDTEQTVVTVDQNRCRGCGTCTSICQFGAIELNEKNSGIFTAQVDEGLCRGCGICVAHCTSGALNQNGYSDSQVMASLQAILA